MLDIKEYLKQTKTVLLTQDAFDELMQRAYAEPRCETCESFNQTRLLIPQRKKGKWLASDDMYGTGICSCCRWDSQEPFDYAIANFHFCPNCGVEMLTEDKE